MAKTSPSFSPGYTGHIKIDTVSLPMQGWSADDSAEALDVMTDADGGFTKNEAGARTIKLTFTVPLLANATASPVEVGDIIPVQALIGTRAVYEGPFTILSANVKADFKGVISLDVTAQNYGNVIPVVTP